MDEKYIPQGVVRLVLHPPLLLIFNNGKLGSQTAFNKKQTFEMPLML